MGCFSLVRRPSGVGSSDRINSFTRDSRGGSELAGDRAGFAGGLAGAYIGGFAIGQRALQRGLAVVLVFAAVKLMVR